MSEEQANYGKSFDAFDKMMRQKPRPPRPGEENAYTKKRAESGERQALSPQKRGLLDIIEGVYYGEIEKIIVKRGEPVFVRVATKDIKLD